MTVVEVATQGRTGCGYNNPCNEFVKSYKLSYSVDGVNWLPVENGKVFDANFDRTTIVFNKLAEPVRCKAFRIQPQDWSGRISMRSEIFVLV